MIEIPKDQRGSLASDLLPDLTPLLDVMFMLIVFFILTANAVPLAMDITLPEDKDGVIRPLEESVITVTLLPKGQGWKINDQPYTHEAAFKAALVTKTASGDPLVIAGDKDVSMDRLLSLLTFLRAQNIEAADIIMSQPQ